MKAEEAKKVILRPAPEIVTEEVANCIIQKITSESRQTVSSLEDCVVDPFVLSLFCHELNKRRMKDGAAQITSKLVNEYGNDILQDFYSEKMQGLHDSNTIKVLEDKLMTSGGHRIPLIYDNGSSPGITDKDMDYLLSNRIIKQDKYDDKTVKIEFAHDVLCRAALKYKEFREKQRIAKLAQRTKKLAYFLGALLVCTIVGIIIWKNLDVPNEAGQIVTVTISKDVEFVVPPTKPKKEEAPADGVHIGNVPEQNPALSDCTDKALIDELKYRGWHGHIHLTIDVYL